MKLISRKLVKLPHRLVNSHKGENGRVLIVGGSPEYVGAPTLAGIAAMPASSGADSVVIAAPTKVAWTINTLNPDLVTKKLKGQYLSTSNFSEIKKMLPNADCLLLGGGVSERVTSLKLINKLTTEFTGLKVLDAAALTSFNKKSLRNSILLPNKNEFARLKKYASLSALLKAGNIVVAKGPQTLIYADKTVYQNKTGNPGLTKAGTGDVLAGLTTGFMAQSKNPLQSAINAVYFIGTLGDYLLKQKKGYSYLASDLAEAIKKIR